MARGAITITRPDHITVAALHKQCLHHHHLAEPAIVTEYPTFPHGTLREYQNRLGSAKRVGDGATHKK